MPSPGAVELMPRGYSAWFSDYKKDDGDVPARVEDALLRRHMLLGGLCVGLLVLLLLIHQGTQIAAKPGVAWKSQAPPGRQRQNALLQSSRIGGSPHHKQVHTGTYPREYASRAQPAAGLPLGAPANVRPAEVDTGEDEPDDEPDDLEDAESDLEQEAQALFGRDAEPDDDTDAEDKTDGNGIFDTDNVPRTAPEPFSDNDEPGDDSADSSDEVRFSDHVDDEPAPDAATAQQLADAMFASMDTAPTDGG